MRIDDIEVQINVWLAGIASGGVGFETAIPAGHMWGNPYTSVISTENFTQQRVTIEIHGLMHQKRGYRQIYTTLSTTPSVTPHVEVLMIIRPWTLWAKYVVPADMPRSNGPSQKSRAAICTGTLSARTTCE